MIFFQTTDPQDIPPVIATPHHYLIQIFRNDVYFVSVAQTEGNKEVYLIIASILKPFFVHLFSYKIQIFEKKPSDNILRPWLFIVPPLFVIEFLHKVFDTFIDYFNECNEQVINDQIVVVYEVGFCYSFLQFKILI